MAIPIHYDPMIAKLITYGDNREEAIQKMIRAIDEYHITGVQTTLSFCRFVMEHEAFCSGKFDTHFVSKYFTPEDLHPEIEPDVQELAALLTARLGGTPNPVTQPTAIVQRESKWRSRRD